MLQKKLIARLQESIATLQELYKLRGMVAYGPDFHTVNLVKGQQRITVMVYENEDPNFVKWSLKRYKDRRTSPVKAYSGEGYHHMETMIRQELKFF